MDSSCGIEIAFSDKASTKEAVAELQQSLSHVNLQHIIVLFSTKYDPEALCWALNESFPDVGVSGCTTAGVISPQGNMHGGILVIAFPQNGFRVISGAIENVRHSGVESASQVAGGLISHFQNTSPCGAIQNAFALLLIDGLSNFEEKIVAAINWEIGDVQLIGGSAGDDLEFKKTTLISEGRVLSEGAVLLLVETEVPFRVFKTQNFDPTSKKLIVTKADTENRIVYELNAEPAAHEYASTVGLMTDDLGPFSFASYPLVVRVGGDYYCRSIRNMNPDGSLSFFCAIDEGLVFTVANPIDMVQSTDKTLKEVDKALGGTDLIIGFDCILRRLDAENRQIHNRLEEVYRRYGVVGFQTYGEQYNAMHINQTLTGIAFGPAKSNRKKSL